ncbi:hypothetical protein MASR2M15_17940 [Anaerolineales bacterium]
MSQFLNSGFSWQIARFSVALIVGLALLYAIVTLIASLTT